jgi:hypothetical protein
MKEGREGGKRDWRPGGCKDEEQEWVGLDGEKKGASFCFVMLWMKQGAGGVFAAPPCARGA